MPMSCHLATGVFLLFITCVTAPAGAFAHEGFDWTQRALASFWKSAHPTYFYGIKRI
jgi:hypothetical protein